jgi:hypothetical protein
MNEYYEDKPFSRLFVNIWLGIWVLIYGTPIIIKTLIGTHAIGFAGLGYPIWVINLIRVLNRNLRLPGWKVFLISCSGIPIAFTTEIISDNIFYNHIFMREPSTQIIYNYYVARLIQILIEIVLPLGIFIYVKIKIWQMTSKANVQK